MREEKKKKEKQNKTQRQEDEGGAEGREKGNKNIKEMASLEAETFTVTFSKAELYE